MRGDVGNKPHACVGINCKAPAPVPRRDRRLAILWLVPPIKVLQEEDIAVRKERWISHDPGSSFCVSVPGSPFSFHTPVACPLARHGGTWERPRVPLFAPRKGVPTSGIVRGATESPRRSRAARPGGEEKPETAETIFLCKSCIYRHLATPSPPRFDFSEICGILLCGV
jgi:hypothetical protein